MATTTFSSTVNMTTDAAFRAWGSAIGTALAAVGLIRTTDTGQIDWTTVIRPATAGPTYAGFEIWRFNDTLQATAPVFIRIDYGTGTSTTANAGIAVTVGRATDGAGTLTGSQVSQRIALNFGNTTTAYSSIAAGDGSRITFGFFVNHATVSSSAVLVVERSKTSVGADDGLATIFLIAGTASGSSIRQQYIPQTGGLPPMETAFIGAISSASPSTYGGNVSVCPATPMAGGPLNPGVNCVIYSNGDFANQTQNPVTLYGTARTYYMVGNVAGVSGIANSRAALLYQ